MHARLRGYEATCNLVCRQRIAAHAAHPDRPDQLRRQITHRLQLFSWLTSSSIWIWPTKEEHGVRQSTMGKSERARERERERETVQVCHAWFAISDANGDTRVALLSPPS